MSDNPHDEPNDNSTALAKVENRPATIMQQAEVLLYSGFLPPALNTPAKVAAVIIRGRELGIGAMEACLSLNIIQGKVTSSTQLMLALIYKSGLLEDIVMERGDPAKVTMKRKGMTPYTVTFGRDDAKAMRLLSKDNYQKQPATMYLWRAIAMCARMVFPDVVSAVYTPDELGVEIQSDTLEGDWRVADVEIPPAIALTSDQVAQAHKLHGEGATRGEIASALNVSKGDLSEALPELFA